MGWSRSRASVAAMKRNLLLVLGLFLLLSALKAGTYYIDWVGGSDANNGTSAATPWKRAPGMPSFAGSGYSHAAGDVFYFKFGVTWPTAAFPWVIANSGSAGNVDTYTTLAGFGTGAAPIFDGGNTSIAGGMIQAVGKSYLAFNGLTCQNDGVTLTADSLSMFDFKNCQQLTFSNLTLTPYTQRAMYIHFDVGSTTYSNFTFTNLTTSHCASQLWFATDANSTTISGWTMTGGYLSDCSTQIGGSVHGDGFVHFFAGSGATGFTVSGIDFHSNKARGDFSRGFGVDGAMTAFFFCESGTYSGLIYNNDFAPSPLATATMFESYSTISGTGNALNIYNNTFVDVGVANAASAGLKINSTSSTYNIKNNLIDGFLYPMGLDTNTANTYNLDYNFENATSGQVSTFQPPDPDSHGVYFAAWQTAPWNYEAHGVLGNPALLTSSPGNNTLTSSSTAKGAGVDLSSTFTADFNGVTRTVPWDMGAYKYAGGVGSGGSSLSGSITLKGSVVLH
jgi:hypothetical protein